jgi:hypothetical protein
MVGHTALMVPARPIWWHRLRPQKQPTLLASPDLQDDSNQRFEQQVLLSFSVSLWDGASSELRRILKYSRFMHSQ